MKTLATSLLIVTVTSAVLVFGEPITGSRGPVVPNGGSRRPATTRLLRRQFNDFLEPPPLPRPVVRSRRGNRVEGTPNFGIGERIARWFNPENGNPSGNQLPGTVDMAPPPPPPPHSAPTAEAIALTHHKPPPPPIPPEHDRPPPAIAPVHHNPSRALPQPSPSHPAHIPATPSLDSQASGTHNVQYHQPNSYPAPNGYSSGSKDCNPCNKSPWIPMPGHSAQPQEAWGQASDAVPLAHAPLPFPEVHPNPLPPIFPPDNFNSFNNIQTLEDNKFLPGVKDHLVPPNANLANVVFTIQEEKIPLPPEPHFDESNAARTADLPIPDQQHQNTHTVQVSPPKPLSYFNTQQTSFDSGASYHQDNTFSQQPQQNYQDNAFSQQPQQNSFNNQLNYHSGKNVDIVPSVPVAAYVASVEYPMHYVQSPIIDISVKSNAPQNQYFPPATAESAQFSKEPHAGLLPLQGEATAAEAVKTAPVDSAPAASVSGNHDIPPCQREKYHGQHILDTATANSQNTHTYVQELTHTTNFESQKLHKAQPKVNLTLLTNHQPVQNSYRLLEDNLKHDFFSTSKRPIFEPTPSPITSDTSPWTSPSTVSPSTITWTPDFVTEDSSSAASATPDVQVTVKPTGVKKSKQIQIIVPYSVNKETGKVQFHQDLNHEVDDGHWLTSYGETEPVTQARKVPPLGTDKEELFDFPKLKDFHQAQESSIVTAELSPTPWTALEDPAKEALAGLQHILATDIRTLLKSEEDSVDRLRLQKNIDNWTAQEFSSVKAVRDTQDQESNFGKTRATSTTASSGTSPHNKLIPSKHIPKEYLTTTPISVPTTHRTSPEVPQNRTEKTTNGWTLFDNLIVPAPTRTTPSSIADRQDPEVITAPPEEETTPAPWEHLQVSISPITREKVYVVTPQNKNDEEVSTTPATTTQVPQGSSRSVNDFIPFRQWKESPSTSSPRPRFSIRPTPGWPKGRGFHSTTNSGNATSTSKLSGAPSPSRPTPRGFAVQTYSGHSKVFTATTSAWTKKKATSSDDKKTSSKATTEMTASPRIDEGFTTEVYPVTTDDAEVTTIVEHEPSRPPHPEIVIVDKLASTTESSRTSRTTREVRTNRGSIRFKAGDDEGQIKRYETPPPRPKPTLHPRRLTKRPPHLVITSTISNASTSL